MNGRPTKKPDMEWDWGEQLPPWFVGEQRRREPHVVRRAWELKQGDDQHPAPTWLGAYLVECPLLHAFWTYWIVSVVHLRDHEGVASAIITRPGSTHELSVLAVEPSSALDPDSFESIRYMMPPDVVEQFGPVTDAQALFVLRGLVNECVRSALHPDSDFRRQWAPAIACAVKAALPQQ